MTTNLDSSFKFLSTEARDLYIPRNIECLETSPRPLDFLRKWVSGNIPLLIKGGALHWNCIQKWNQEYLITVLKDKEVTVAVTPSGYADAIATCEVDGQMEELFVLPDERLMPISKFFSKLNKSADCLGSSSSTSEGVFYLQKQNSNLTEEFPELLNDIDGDLEWASEAFGDKPNAINLWIGDERSVTSLHKDPFENIYCVVKGHKDFTLLPPTDRPWIPYKILRVAEYVETSPGQFNVRLKEPDDGGPKDVPWIAIDPLNPDLEAYPQYRHAHPIQVRVEAGDLLYLPSLWFHHVRQSDGCIAVNFWYDMAMDIKFAYFQFLEELAKSHENTTSTNLTPNNINRA